MAHISLSSLVGALTLWSDGQGITRLDWEDHGEPDVRLPELETGRIQLSEYFAGSRKEFDVPLAPRGSEFQQNFYAALCAIPYGETRTYGDLAVSAQAIGQACGANPIPILIPCHRVLAATGLGVFQGAEAWKRR